MRRRDFALLVLGAVAMRPLQAHAQRAAKIPRIGVLIPGTAASFSRRVQAFVDGLSLLGRVEGLTIEIEWKWANDRVELLPALAAQLVQDKVDVIVTGGTPAAQALKAATQSIPIVVAIMADPVAAGIV